MSVLTSNTFNVDVVSAHSSELVSRTDVGFSDGGDYIYTGATHFITPSTSLATVNADSSIVSGDAVLFQAGGVWDVGSASDLANRLKCKSGVLYGRYGTGANPQFRNTLSRGTTNFRGVIDIVNVNNVTIDGIDCTHGTESSLNDSKGHFAIFVNSGSSNTTIRRLTVGRYMSTWPTFSKTSGTFAAFWGGGIIVQGTSTLVEFCEVQYVYGGPHESIAFTGADGYTCRYNYVHHCNHAGINNKGNAKNGEIYGNEIHHIYDDPSFYVERADTLDIHDNWIHDPEITGTGKPLFNFGVEDLGDVAIQYTRNITAYRNIVMNCLQQCAKWNIFPTASGPTPILDNIHLHHNTFLNGNNENENWQDMLQLVDNRAVYDSNDWSNLKIENNIFWENGNAKRIDFDPSGIPATVRNNLYETGVTNNPAGTSPIYTTTEPFADRANNDYTPTGAAVGAGHDGSDVGAAIIWNDNSWM